MLSKGRREQIFTINEKGKLIKQAFNWKADGISTTEISLRLKARGLTLYRQSLQRIFNNPFYCGLISHKLLDGEIIEGIQPPLILKELFLKVNAQEI